MKHLVSYAASHAALLTVAGLATAAVVAAAPAAHASGDDDGVGSSGSCSNGATWKLEVKTDDGGLEVEAEVDSNTSGQAWAWKLRDNGVRIGKGTSTTTGRSGSFSVEKHVADRAGADTVTFRATYRGQVCKGRVTL